MLYRILDFPEVLIEPITSTEYVSNTCSIRESMKNLPSWSQGFLTWLTAVPLRSQKPTQHHSSYHLITTLGVLMIGILAGYTGISLHLHPLLKIMLLLINLACSLSAMRKLQVVIVHHCSHSNFFDRNSPWNERLGNTLSFLLFTEPFKAYQKSHIQDHHFTAHMSESDPTVKFLFEKVGLKPGMSVECSKKQLIKSFLSPEFYWETWKQRFNEQKQASKKYQLLASIYWVSLISIGVLKGFWALLLVSYFFPLFVLYPISSALRLVVEHTFPSHPQNRKFDLASHSYLTNAVFCGEEYPTRTFDQMIWFIRMLFIHFPSRFLVLVGDTPVHDHHHRHPLYKNWPNYAYARFSEIHQIKPGYSPYREIWGLKNALNHSLITLQNQRSSV